MTKPQAVTELQRIMRMRHYAVSTRESYTHWLSRFFDYLRRHRSLPLAPAERMEAFLSDLQEILGHKSLETTMQYIHPEIERVTSPLEALFQA